MFDEDLFGLNEWEKDEDDENDLSLCEQCSEEVKTLHEVGREPNTKMICAACVELRG